MSKRKQRMKRRRFIFILAVLAIIIVFVIKKVDGSSTKKVQETKKNDTEQSANSSVKNDSSGISEIIVSPEIYTAHTGETINLDSFNVQVKYKSGKTEDVDENLSFSTESDIINVQDDAIVISDDAMTADSGKLTISYGGVSTDLTIKLFNALKDNISEASIVTNADAYDMVVNKERNLPSDYVPEDLVPVNEIPTSLKNPEVNQLRKVAYDALKELFATAKDEKSYKLYARSGYRSYATQNDLYDSYVANHGQQAADTFSAKPGQSEHQSGLAMDITCEAMNYQLDDTFFDTDEGKWVAENAHKFGFIIRYPKGKESITGYQYEPWHLRYVGKTLAKEIYDSHLTLEEYFEQ